MALTIFYISGTMSQTIYYAALRTSCGLAREEGAYETYEGSPISKGIMQFDMWGVTPTDRWDWQTLRADIAKVRMIAFPSQLSADP